MLCDEITGAKWEFVRCLLALQGRGVKQLSQAAWPYSSIARLVVHTFIFLHTTREQALTRTA